MITKINDYYNTPIYSGIPLVLPEIIEKNSTQNKISEENSDTNKRKIDGVYKGDFFNHHNLK